MKNFILIHLESLSELIFRTNWQLFSNINKIIEESVYYSNYFSSATSTLMVISDICYGGMYREKCTKLENDYHDLENHTSLFDELVDTGYKAKGIIWPELTTYSKCSQSEELQNLSIAATSLLIEQSLNNNIDSFEIKYVGPLRFSMLNDVLLDAYGINISLIKDKTPIPHNLCFQQRSRKMRLL